MGLPSLSLKKNQIAGLPMALTIATIAAQNTVNMIKTFST
jgi:hypothetical protein